MAPELDDFLLLSVLGDQITGSTLMHRYLLSKLILVGSWNKLVEST